MAVPTLINKVNDFDTFYKDANNNFIKTKLVFDTPPADKPPVYPYVKGAAPVLYHPSLTPAQIAGMQDKMDYDQYAATSPNSNNMFYTHRKRVLDFIDPIGLEYKDFFYGYVNEYSTDTAGTYENYVSFVSTSPGDDFLIINQSISINSDYQTIDDLFDAYWRRTIKITKDYGTELRITGNMINTLNVSNISTTYPDGSSIRYFDPFRPNNILPDGIQAFRFIVRKKNYGFANPSFQILYFMPENRLPY